MERYEIPVWEYNGLKLPFDFDDVECMERYEIAFQQMKEDGLNEPKTGKRTDYIKYYCESFFRVFDTLFGVGTSDRLFDNKMNSRLCFEAYDDFMNFVNTNILRTDTKMMNNTKKTSIVNESKNYPNKTKNKKRKHHYDKYSDNKTT